MERVREVNELPTPTKTEEEEEEKYTTSDNQIFASCFISNTFSVRAKH